MDQACGGDDVGARHGLQTKGQKGADALFERLEGHFKGGPARFHRLDMRRVIDSPVGGCRMARPDWAGFTRGASADGEDVIQFWCIWRSKLVPRFAAYFCRQGYAMLFQCFQRHRIDLARGFASSREGSNTA